MEENGKKHERSPTLTQTVMATFKKIQNAAQAKMREQQRNSQRDILQELNILMIQRMIMIKIMEQRI